MENRAQKITQEMLALDEEPEWFVGEVRFEGPKNTILIEGYYLDPFGPKIKQTSRAILRFKPFAKERPEYEFLVERVNKERVNKPIQLIFTSKSLTFIFDENGEQKIQTFETNAKKIKRIKAQIH